jgi:sulfur carrier protein ThiS
MAATIKVTLAKLAAPLVVANIKPGTTVKDFLAKKEINFTKSVRVNGKAVGAEYTLKANDIITTATEVQGG